MTDEHDVRALLVMAQEYYDSMVQGKPERLRAVFDTEARFYGIRDQERITRDLDVFLDMVRQPDPTTLIDRHCHAEVLDVSGSIAVLKVVDRFRGRTYTDYLSALKGKDGWRIVSKTFWAWDR